MIGGSIQSLLEDSSSRADLMDYVSTRKYDPDKKIIALTLMMVRVQMRQMVPVICWIFLNSMIAKQHFFAWATDSMMNLRLC